MIYRDAAVLKNKIIFFGCGNLEKNYELDRELNLQFLHDR